MQQEYRENRNDKAYVKDKKKKQSTGKLGKFIAAFVFIICGVICGYYSGRAIGRIHSGSLKEGIMGIFFLFVFLYGGMYLQIIIHEAGHLVAGKLSGYEFISFRIGRWMLVREKEKLKIKQFTIKGTGGQCLMMPPAYNEGNYPSKLYNLGGFLSNIMASSLCLGIYFLVPKEMTFSLFLLIMALVGFASALVNGLPLYIGGITNDGANVLSLSKDQEANRAFWLQLQINAMLIKGTRLRDMPKEWFEFDNEKDLTNPIVCTLGVLRANYLFDKREFDEARSLMEMLLEKATGLMGIHKNELRCDLLFERIRIDSDEKEIKELYTKELKNYIKATKSYVSRRRLLYAYELLVNKDEKAAKKQREAFEKAAKVYPYTVEIEAERELLKSIDEKKDELDKREIE